MYRFLPRLNPAVNDYWLCDYGRFLSEKPEPARDRARDGPRRRRHADGDRAGGGRADRGRDPPDDRRRPGRRGLFFLGSAHLTNEENFLLRKIGDHLSCPNRDAVVDRSRVRRMKSKTEWIEGDHAGANFAGAKDMGLSPAGRLRARGGPRGKRDPEVIVVADGAFAAAADDPEKAVAILRRARFLAVAGRVSTALTRAADVLLPAASLAEKEGTFTNVQGRVQRLHRAFLPKPPVRPHWELLLLLAVSLGWGERAWTPVRPARAHPGGGRRLWRRRRSGARGGRTDEEGPVRLDRSALRRERRRLGVPRRADRSSRPARSSSSSPSSLGRAPGRGADPGPAGSQPRGAVRPDAACRRRRQVLLQGGLRPRERGPGAVPPRAGAWPSSPPSSPSR